MYRKVSTKRASRYHHTLKSLFLQGNRNRRIDIIIYTLMDRMLDYFTTRRLRQEHGMEGDDVVTAARRRVEIKALLIPDSDIEVRRQPQQ